MNLRNALLAMAVALFFAGCCRKPRIVYLTVPTPSCLEAVGEAPELRWTTDLTPIGCDADRFDACFTNIGPLIRYLRAVQRWREQVELSCQGESSAGKEVPDPTSTE